jgi:peptide deformylase
MTQKRVRVFPDPVLRQVAKEVQLPDETTRALVSEMFDVMREEGGIGLAAPQVGVSARVIVVSVEENGFERLALINPVVVTASREKELFEEGCLSIPGVRADVERPSRVVVRGVTKSGKLVEISAGDLLARVLQHEIDHLNGVLFIDRLAGEERRKVERELGALQDSFRRGGARAGGAAPNTVPLGPAVEGLSFRGGQAS